ncbi:protein EDS1B isoform X2 [Cryptomeria japonica]|uniref:protein EDS1B isoform X2 n=1 Tax=Cryptomeria japonica TaxID=3369 RepID=UPI0027DA277C|nr:protein EDS1B isoform X2 [Cryptomeria japonica]
MAIDLQNKPEQTEYLDSHTKPRFSVGLELATLITSCGILDRAWQGIYNVSKNNVDFFSQTEIEGVAYVTFPSFSTKDFIATDSRYGEYNIQKEEIFSPCLRGDADKPAFVHKGAFDRFQRILESSDFKDKIEGLKSQAIIFVGHSMGGAVATLVTLWYLQNKARHKSSCFCITFGSPLVGNAILGEATGREGWTGKFCHVVSKYDIVPRMLLAPFESIAEPLSALVHHWRRIMASDSDAVTLPCIPLSLLEVVLNCTSTIANNYPGESGVTSPYRPFGTYMLCSTQGAVSVEDSEAALKMLYFTMQGMHSCQLAGTCALYHTGYRQILEAITKDLLNVRPITDIDRDSFEMGIVLESEAMAIGPQASSALREAGEKKNKQDMNIEKLNNELSEMQSYMAEVEWYKALCKKGSGYYDSFKNVSEKRDIRVNLLREKLTTFWQDIVEKEEKHVLPSDFRCQNKWINAGTAYRRLVEPLDIAHYYHMRKDSKKYLSNEVRPYHHRVLEKWMDEKEQTRTGRPKKNRINFASLTLDSCFWARLEEANRALTSLPQEQEQHQVMNDSLRESREFEKHICNMIRDKSISEEVFLKESSLMIWWEQYISYLQDYFPQWMSGFPTEPICNFMKSVFGSWDLAQGFGKFCLLPLIAAMESTVENYLMGFFGKLSYGLYAKLILYVL